MKRKVSFFKKMSLFREFRKKLKINETELEEVFNARIDKAYRIYSVINVPMEGEPYNLRKGDIDIFAETLIKNYSLKLSEYLDNKGLKEMYGFYEIRKVDKYSYLVVIGFTLPKDDFRSHLYYNKLRYRIIPIFSAIILIITLLIFIFK